MEGISFMAKKKEQILNDEINEKEMHESDTEEENAKFSDEKEVVASEVEERSDKEKVSDEQSEKPVEPKEERDEAELKSASDYLEHLQRLQAEFSNYKKRVERERLEFTKLVKAEFIKKLLPVVDDFERFIMNHKDEQLNQNNNQDFMKGFRLIYEKLMSLLKDEGVIPLGSEGKDFDPNFHEALIMEKTDDESKDGKVLEEWERGYLFNDNVLRVAKVKVGKHDPESNDK